MSARSEREERLYRAEVGKPTALPDDHPDAWQWEYTGSKAEREELLERLELGDPEESVVIAGQVDIFGGEA